MGPDRPAGPRPRRIAVAVALAAVTAVSACSSASPRISSAPRASTVSQAPSSGRASQGPPRGPAWLLTRSALARLLTDRVVRDELRSSRIYEILQPGQHALAGVTAEPVVTFASAVTLENAVRRGQFGPGIFGALYDPEAWSFTPVTEQRDPVGAAARAAAVAHAHGLRLIVTPALDLTTILDPAGGTPRWRRFLALNLAGQLARVADVIELQAQSLERDTTAYAAFVRAAAAQATAAHPGISVLAGLSTNPPGGPVDSPRLAAAIRATRSAVSGYWLNIPGPGPRCPACHPARPDIAIGTFRLLR